MTRDGDLQRLPSLPERGTRKGLFKRLGKPTPEENLRGGTPDAPRARGWFGSSLSRTASLDPDLPISNGTHHSRTRSLEDGQVPPEQELESLKKIHRRGRSFTTFFRKNLGLSRPSSSIGSADELEGDFTVLPGATEAGPASRLGVAPAAPRTPGVPTPLHPRATPGSTSSLSCFGIGLRPAGSSDGEERVSAPPSARSARVWAEAVGAGAGSPMLVLPAGASSVPSSSYPLSSSSAAAAATTAGPSMSPSSLSPRVAGIRNVGNTCFVNAALQCLRHTPGLAAGLAPDLAQRVATAAAASQDAGDAQAPLPLEAEAPGSVDVHALARASTDRSGAMEAFVPGLEAVGEEGAEAKQGAGWEEEPAWGLSVVWRGPGQGAGEAGAEPGSTTAAAEGAVPTASTEVAAPPKASAAPQAADIRGEEGEGGASPCAATPVEVMDVDIQQAGGGEVPTTSVARAAEDSPATDPDGAPPAPCPTPPEAGSPASAAVVGASPVATPATPAPAPATVAPLPPARPPRGELLAAFIQLVLKLCLHTGSGGMDPMHFIRTLKGFPMAAEFLDGGQHDCQEVLRVLMDLLHDDLKPLPPPAIKEAEGSAEGAAREPPLSPPQRPLFPEAEVDKADRHWQKYLERDSSTVTELFGGQLQSSITCHKCNGRFTMYEPFWDLSLPLAKEGKQSSLSWLGIKGTPASISDCLTVFAADEKLEGEEAFSCEVCKAKTSATKHLRLQRLPQVLVLHIKRFKYRGFFTDKLTASVSYPLTGLSLDAYLSPEALSVGQGGALYDLYAVSNHYGNLSGGHYTAMCRVQAPEDAPGAGDWYCFNDDMVNRVSEDQVMSQYAYILFYARRPST